MKSIAFLLVVVAVAVTADQETFKIPQAIVDKIKNNAKPCAAENNLDESVILKVADGTVPDSEAGSKFLLCFTKNSGYIDDDGHLVVDKLASILNGHPLQNKFKEALSKCNEISKDSPLATVMAMHKCFAERPPIRLLF